MRGPRKKSLCARPAACCVAGLLSALACLPAAAQSTTSTAPGSNTAPAMPSPNDWSYELTPYFWLAGVSTDYKLGPLPANTLSVSSGDLLRNLNMGAMGAFEARKGAWGGFLDAIYVDLGVSNSYAGGLLGGYDLKIKEQIYSLGATYRLIDSSTKVDLLAGGRYVNIGTSFYVPPSLRGLGAYRQDTVAGWAGIVGVRAVVPVADRWSLMGYLDGGGGSGYNTWQVMAGAIYQWTPSTSVKFGYRLLDFRPDDAVVDKMQTGGVYAGLGFKF